MYRKFGLFLFVLVIVSSCKTSSVTTGNTTRALSANKVIKYHYTNDFNKETLTAKMKVKYKGKSNLPSVTASLRIKKDEAIWISLSKLGFPLGKALITQNKVSYYEKINKTYFEGDFKLLSHWLGTELDYEKVQNLLFGQAILNLKDEKHNVDFKDNNYTLTPKKSNELFDILYLINNQNFKVNKQEIHQTDEEKTLTIDYHNYEKIDGAFFPKELLITAKDQKYITTIDINYRSVIFNNVVSFPFTIPNGYKEIELK